MSVTSVNLRHTGRDGSLQEDGVRAWKSTYRVIMDDPTNGPITAMFASGIPAFYSTYSAGTDTDLGAYCKRITPTAVDDSRLVWDVVCEFDSKFDFAQYNRSLYPNPLDRPVEVSWTSTYYTIALEKDKDGNAVKNTVGDPFDPPLTQEISRPTVTIVKNLPDFDPSIKYDYENAISSDAFLGADAKQWLCRRIDGTLQYESVQDIGLVAFWQVTFVFEHNRDGWNPVKVLNVGYNYLDSGTVKKVMVNDNQPPSAPVRLGEMGDVLADTDDDYFVDVNPYREVAFSGLGLF